MAMGRKKQRQDALWIVASDLPKSAGHPFYQRLSVLLEARGFDRFVERLCERFYAEIGSIPVFDGHDVRQGTTSEVAEQARRAG